MKTNLVERNIHRGDGRQRSRAVKAAFLLPLILLAFVAIMAAGCGENEPGTAATGGACNLQLEETYYDFGDVPVGQKVEHDFTITNAGSDTLKLGAVDVKLLEGC